MANGFPSSCYCSLGEKFYMSILPFYLRFPNSLRSISLKLVASKIEPNNRGSSGVTLAFEKFLRKIIVWTSLVQLEPFTWERDWEEVSLKLGGFVRLLGRKDVHLG